ncbi:MAG: methyl-accepting chemotaxis protein, partial [bacterium]|nr:methyl-accepting chemotaxis protein [bacterium]
SQASDAGVIDIAGRQRMLTYKMMVEVQDLVLGLQSESSVENTRTELLKTMALFDESLRALAEGGATMGTDGTKVRLPGATGRPRDQLNEVANMWHHYENHVQVITAPKPDIISDKFFEATSNLEKDAKTLLNEFNKAAVLLKEASESKSEMLKTVQIGAFLLTVIFAALFWAFANSAVVRPICKTSEIMDSIAAKDLTKSLPTKSADETGKMGRAVNSMIDNISALIKQILESATVVAGASEELSVSAGQIAQGTSTQSEKTHQVAAAATQASATLVDVARNVVAVVDVAQKANEVALKGGDKVKKSVSGIRRLSQTTKETSLAIKSLESRSQGIGDIIKVINDIADQTNLLALNAAIEAARAGEQGRGFSVVADEVRKLAEKTTKATQEIEEMVRTIQQEAGNTLKMVEEDVAAVEEGVALAMDTGTNLDEIIEHVERVSSMIRQISSAAEEQAGTITQISADIDAVADVTKDNSSGSKAIARTSQEIANLASSLNASVELFKLSRDQSA